MVMKDNTYLYKKEGGDSELVRSPSRAQIQRMGHENELATTPNKSKSVSQLLTRLHACTKT